MKSNTKKSYLQLKNTFRYFTYSLFLLGVLTFSSCNFLELDSPNGVDQSTVLTNADGIRSARIGMYAALSDKNYYGGTYPLAMEAHSDNGANGGYAVAAYDELGTLKAVTPNNIVIGQMWLAIYSPINIANQILANVDNVIANTKDDNEIADLKSIKGEALFVRGLGHFDAMRVWGEHWDMSSLYGIPVSTSVQTFDKVIARSTVANTYAAILNDLSQALALVSDTEIIDNEVVDKSRNYITKNAINGLIARLCIYAGDKTRAAQYADEVINSSGTLYEAADYGKVFTTKLSDESIFELGYTTQYRSSYNQLSYVREGAIRTEVVFLAGEDLNTFFKTRTDDVRANFVNFTTNDASIAPDGRTEKYRGEQTKDNPAYILRLAEQYLIAAEAKGKTDGLALLNTIRQKRGMKALANSITDAEFAQAVADERRAELNMEGHRYFDLARTGKVQQVMGVDVKSNFPIPSREITASNGAILQNKGY